MSGPPRVLVIVGSGRSGTTIVLEAVATIPGVVAVPRLAGRVPRLTVPASHLARWGRGPVGWRRPSPESTALFTEAGITQRLQSGLGGAPVTLADVEAERVASLPTRLAQVREVGRAVTVAVKNTAGCGRVPLLAELMPEAAFVHVVRSPTEVVESLLRTDFWPTMTLWWDGRTTTDYGRDLGLGQEQVAARHWARQVSAAADSLAGLPRRRWLRLRYSDLVADPVAELSRLGRLGLAAPMPDAVARLGIRPQRRRGAVSPAVVEAVRAECVPVATRMGVGL